MAGETCSLSCAFLQFPRSCFRSYNFLLGCVHFNLKKSNCKLAPFSIFSKGHHLGYMRCWCFGSLLCPGASFPLEWISAVDQALLLVSTVSVYMAGVIPVGRSFAKAKRESLLDKIGATSSGSAAKRETLTQSESIWNKLRGKLYDVQSSNECDICDVTVDHNSYTRMLPLCLHAVPKGPRIRLLWAILQQLQEKVNNIAEIHKAATGDSWMVVLSEVLHESFLSSFFTWLERELSPEIKTKQKSLLASLHAIIKKDTVFLKHVEKLGKEDLYSDLIFFLRFGLDRQCFQYDIKLLIEHGLDILEDMVIIMAERIACIYIELVSFDSDMALKMSSLNFPLVSLSTRELQKLRNEVLLHQWLLDNIVSVVSMYEDRFGLFVLQTRVIDHPVKSQRGKICWWKLFFKKDVVTSPYIYHISITQLSLPVKRTKELRALTGWRFCFCLFLEFLDIGVPMARAITVKVGNAVSFFLVCLIGRTFGLICTGIKQAFVWK